MKLCQNCSTTFSSRGWRCPSCGHEPESHDDFLVFSPELANNNDGFEARFFHSLAELEEQSFWFEARNKLIFWALREIASNPKNFLEIGVGTGFVLKGIVQEFPHLESYGSEIFVKGLQYAKARLPNLELFQMDARSLPFIDHFDIIGVFDVLEHIEEDETALQQIRQALHLGGSVIITVPQHAFLWSVVDELSHHKRRYSQKELLEKLDRAGFKTSLATSFVSLLLPVLFFSRMTRKESVESYDRSREHTIHPILNRLFAFTMSLERALIKMGFRFPIGGSLLVVATRIK